MQRFIEACSPSPFLFTADVRYEEEKNFECDDATDNVVEVTAYILEISAKKKKRNCFRSGSAKNIVDNVQGAVWGAAERQLIVRTVFCPLWSDHWGGGHASSCAAFTA